MREIELHSTALLSRWKPVMWEKKQPKSWFICFNSLQRSFPDANVRPPRARRRRLLLFSPESGSLQQLSASSSPAAAAPVRLLNLGIAVWLPRGRKAGKKEKKKRGLVKNYDALLLEAERGLLLQDKVHITPRQTNKQKQKCLFVMS